MAEAIANLAGQTGTVDGDGASISASGAMTPQEQALARLDLQNDPMLALVYQSLSVGSMSEANESTEASSTLRQLERVLELDLKQAIVWDLWDNPEEALEERPVTVMVGSAGTAAGLFSIGYAMWGLRGGAFVTVMTSAIPSWRIVDPAAILSAYRTSGRVSNDGIDEMLRQN